jgi:hypothetical protein
MHQGFCAPDFAPFDIDFIVTKAEDHTLAKRISGISGEHVEIKP